MKILTGLTKNIQCKNNTVGMVLHYMESTFADNGKDNGYLTGTCFLNQTELETGVIEVQGELKIGRGVRIFKETQGGMDRVTTIITCEPDLDFFKGKKENK